MGDISSYNGGAVVAMVGDQCVAIACDKRLGMNQQITIGTNFPKAFRVTDKSFFAASGLATDVQTMYVNHPCTPCCRKEEIEFRVNMYEASSESKMSINKLSNMVSTMLYSRRFSPWFVEAVVAGLDAQNKPFISCFDLIGAPCNPDDFVVAGTCAEQLYGICEALFKPNAGPDELFEIVSQCLMAGIDRDCLSGWGAQVYIITPTSISLRTLKTRMD
ncbi:proteasome subunit beta type 3, putative [Theileria equi strain WA]|uniref:Proteasome subunit beta n=1 Tax=Theileria equi strain WA TaxID=1537102 RepID=L0B216_THEEQ|nr:proteasome subunit beta type 3, putative [Theileria equi strain WA]AFZ81291.1 proteasome subunit beta type 3, putative [Theileria equi strain WA]|eukprot:XP_004830957.1 proteasome subunit beta type 3, putative [Theileria equi strain WA]